MKYLDFFITLDTFFYVDENECLRDNNDCKDVNARALREGVAKCSDSVGNYSCVCKSGFVYDSNTRMCTGNKIIL